MRVRACKQVTRLHDDTAWARSDLKKLRAVSQISIARGRDNDHVFKAHAANTEIVKPGFHCHHVASSQGRVNRGDPRGFVDIQAQAVSGAMKETLHASLDSSRRKPPGLKEGDYFLVNVFSVGAVPNHVEADLLSGLNGCVNLFEFVGRAATHHGSTQIAKVAGFLGPRENVEDDRCVRFDGAAPFVVRIDALVPGGDNGVTREPALPHDRRVDNGFQSFRRQSGAIEAKIPIATNFGPFERANAGLETQRRDPERFGDMFHLVNSFGFTLSEKRIPLDLHAKALGSELICQ